MSKSILVSFFALLFMGLFAQDATANDLSVPNGINPPRWEKLGMRRVDFRADRDEIIVTAAEGQFDAIKIICRKGAINMHKCIVYYGNGNEEEIELRNNFKAGSESRVVDLNGKDRIIRKVVFFYDTKNFSGRKAVVELWGRH